MYSKMDADIDGGLAWLFQIIFIFDHLALSTAVREG